MSQPIPDLSFDWGQLGYDDGGLPVHLPMGVTESGQGPEDDDKAHHYVCWCGTYCSLEHALNLATRAGDKHDRT